MKTKTTSPSFPFQAARILFLACATLASALFSLDAARAQSADSANTYITNSSSYLYPESITVSGSSSITNSGTCTLTNSSSYLYPEDIIVSGNSSIITNSDTLVGSLLPPSGVQLTSDTNASYFGTNTLTFHNSYDGETHITGGNLVINTSLTTGTISLEADSTLTVDGALTVKSISCDVPNATMILCPNAVVDLGGSTLTISLFTLAGGAHFSIHGLNDQNATISLPFKLSNGATIINGSLIFDTTQTNALHLIESNDHSTESPGTLTLRNQN